MARLSKLSLLLLLPIFACAQGPTRPLATESVILTSASGVEVSAETGRLMVPEHRGAENATLIPLEFVRLRSKAAEPGTPLVYLEGGPGASCTWQATSPQALENWVPLLAGRDVILLDQRGTGAVAERMTYIHQEPLPDDVLVSEEAAIHHFRQMLPSALATWKERKIDLAGYNTRESARDIDDLRQALRMEKISIMGFSYGTHLGQSYLKYFGNHVDKAVLVGVEGLGETYKLPLRMDAQFRKLSALVAADEPVGKDVPDLVGLYQRVARKLTDAPVTLRLRNPLTRETEERRVGKFGLDYVLFRDLGDASDLPVIPRLLADIDRGEYASLTWFVQKRFNAFFGLHAMSLATDIASGAAPERRAEIDRQAAVSLFGNVLNNPVYALGREWPVPKLDGDFRAAFSSTVPILLLSGTLDMNTPPYQAERFRWQLPDAHHIVVENAGHEQILRHPAIGPAIQRFLDGKDVSEVTAAYPPLRFLPVRGDREGVRHPAAE